MGDKGDDLLRRVIAVLALVLAAAGLVLLLSSEEGVPVDPGESPIPRSTGPTAPRTTFADSDQADADGTGTGDAALDPERGASSSTASANDSPRRAGAESALIRGRVEDPDGNPIYSARVNRTTTDSLGTFVLPGVPASGQLKVSARGYLSRVVPMGRKPSRTVKVVLIPARTLRILVVAAESGLPIESATVAIQMGAVHSVRRTNKTGELVLTVGTESLTLDVFKEKRVSLVCHDEDHPTISLELGRGVRGVVAHPDGTPIPDAPVVIVGKSQRRWPQSEKTDSEGHFHLESGIRAGERIAVYSWDQEYSSRMAPDWLPAGSDNVQVETHTRGGAVISGRGGPRNGEPIVAWQISARQALPNQKEVERWRGYAQFARLAPGRYRARGLDDRWYGQAFEVKPGRITQVRWTPDPGRPEPPTRGKPGSTSPASGTTEATPPPPSATLRAAVEPRQPVDVVLRRRGRAVRRLTCDDGTIALDELPYGDYSLEVKRRDGQTFLLDVTLPLGEELLTIPVAD